MRQFTNITIEEMRSFFPKEKGWYETSERHIHEYAFEFPMKQNNNVRIKVFTSIRKDIGDARSKGQDAIRVTCFNLKTKKGIVKTRKVLRINSWEKNLKKAILDVFYVAKKRI